MSSLDGAYLPSLMYRLTSLNKITSESYIVHLLRCIVQRPLSHDSPGEAKKSMDTYKGQIGSRAERETLKERPREGQLTGVVMRNHKTNV